MVHRGPFKSQDYIPNEYARMCKRNILIIFSYFISLSYLVSYLTELQIERKCLRYDIKKETSGIFRGDFLSSINLGDNPCIRMKDSQN